MLSAGLNVTGGLSMSSMAGFMSEASVCLNGAHLNYMGRLGGWIRKLSSTTPSSREPEPQQIPAAVSSDICPTLSVLSELGLTGYTEQQWKTALSTTMSLMDSSLANGQAPTCRNILTQFSRHYGVDSHKLQAPQLQNPLRPHQKRFYSTLTRPFRRPHPLNHAQVLLRSQWPVFRRYVSVYQLEDRANAESDHANAQARYLEAVVEFDPQYVIRRFESGRYAVNSEVRAVYQRAIEKTGQAENASTQHSSLQSFFQHRGQGSKLGSPDNPVHMSLTQGRMSVLKSEVWSTIRMIIGLMVTFFLITILLSSTIFNSVKNSTKQMQMNYHPDTGEKKYTFDDVQGVDEAKEEVQEVVEFLKNPEKFQRLGAKLPTGVLLVGAPGTGKTLLAKAIAGEADVPFFFVSGSEFDEMFVGVGASRVRKLFDTARSHKPCVLFIDELDAVGGKRHSSPMHPYSRMTLNQLLVELDGYKELEGVIIIGATNFPEALDEALTRPGRFDNRIVIPMPDIRARFNILKLHAKKVILDEDVDLEVIARATIGFSGADLANLINQAALRGCVENKDAVTYEDLEYARDKISMGRERRSAVIDPQEKHTTAYHEAGHAIMALYTPGAMPIYKATIIPRGSSLGMVTTAPEKDVLTRSKKEMLASIDVTMGGRVAEEIIYGAENVTTGAGSDLQQATKVANHMVKYYGMNDSIGPMVPDKECSPQTKRIVEEEVSKILKESYERTRNLLRDRATEHKRLAEGLLKYETLTGEEVKLVVANKPLSRKI